MNFRTLSWMFLPHRMAAITVKKLSSMRIISAWSLAAEHPSCPIVKPTLASLRALESLKPSPVTPIVEPDWRKAQVNICLSYGVALCTKMTYDLISSMKRFRQRRFLNTQHFPRFAASSSSGSAFSLFWEFFSTMRGLRAASSSADDLTNSVSFRCDMRPMCIAADYTDII